MVFPPEEAAKRPLSQAHTIWEIVHHISAWNGIVERRLADEQVEVTPEMDWPAPPAANEAAWKRTLEDLRESRQRLRRTVETLADTELDEKPSGSHDSRYILVHGLIQHDLYHAGQIAVLKKVLQ